MFIAVDWGTTNRRIYAIDDDGAVTATLRDDRGATAVSDYPAEISAMRAQFGDLPVLLAGMVGSNIGWRAVPYVRAPAGAEALAGALAEVAPGVFIVPGVSWQDGDRADVMRGEEVQLLGAVASGAVAGDALLCQPGTHCKWVQMAGGRIARFTTAMTGELFALLRKQGLLAAQLGGAVENGAAFRAGVAEGARRDLAASLFAIRAAGVLGLRDDADAAAHCSGLLIGADVAARLAQADGQVVDILSDPALGGLYQTAVEVLGGTARLHDSQTAFLAGITRIRELAQ
ncbi:2-oxo-3-deoxygalactonate kinase [Croceibacterium mercuriale]|uniref:2-oxo-3-deoxygalactonate kinase n=1 Tax=Croceibacterium mercuriale TaxID=1572751 RepID=A0A0B2C314_9SPHN|nr:2-dehydro-3-deoxygalactonokinase [Croceibacterium mercuriale]KHL26396.1 2-oxo-3-deoxygalactonate kinase [Croceibacterium mercuriale]